MAVPSIEEILAQGGGSPVVIDGVMYQPIFESSGQGETFEQGPLTQVVAYKPGETATGQSYKTYSPSMEEIGTNKFQKVGNIGTMLQTAAEDLAPLAAMALTAGGAGGALGGFLTGGGLTGTAASALGNALISGGAGALTGQDPLKAALLAAGGTYAGGLFGGSTPTSDAQFVAADAAQLASQGLGAEQIQQVLQSSGVNVGTAISAADVAASGMPADQIADYIAGNKGLFSETASQAPATPTTVTTSPEGLQTVTTTQAPVSIPAVSFPVIPSALAPSVPLAEVPPTPVDQTVEVTAKREEPATVPTTGVSIDLPSALSGGGLETADQAARTEKQGTGLTLKDLYTALQALGAVSSTGLFGGGGGGGGQQRAFVPPTATVPTGNEDYYNAVQQYYNTYMPTAPRDVSTPLQQWYQGKFGG